MTFQERWAEGPPVGEPPKTDLLTPDEVRETLLAAEGATIGPWETHQSFGMAGMHHAFIKNPDLPSSGYARKGRILGRIDTYVEFDPDGKQCTANAKFITYARKDVPRLCRAYLMLWDELKAERKLSDDLVKDLGLEKDRNKKLGTDWQDMYDAHGTSFRCNGCGK